MLLRKRKDVAFGLGLLVAVQAAAVTLHRSFRTQEVGFGGGASVLVPVEARVAKAIDEAQEKEAKRPKVAIGTVTKVCSGDLIHVLTDGDTLFNVRLSRIDAPEIGQPYGKEAVAYLTKMIHGRTVRVEYVGKNRQNLILGVVYLNRKGVKTKGDEWEDVNLHLVATGNARHANDFENTPAYSAAEAAAKAERLGLWAFAR